MGMVRPDSWRQGARGERSGGMFRCPWGLWCVGCLPCTGCPTCGGVNAPGRTVCQAFVLALWGGRSGVRPLATGSRYWVDEGGGERCSGATGGVSSQAGLWKHGLGSHRRLSRRVISRRRAATPAVSAAFYRVTNPVPIEGTLYKLNWLLLADQI